MSNKVFNVQDFCFGIPAIEKFSQVAAPGLSPESLAHQSVALALWQRERDWVTERIGQRPELLMEWKLRRLSQFVDYAFSNIPFYRRHYGQAGFEKGGIRSWADFESLPLVTKQDMVVNFPVDNVAPGFDRSNCRLIRSSGSTGKPVSLLVDRWREDLDTVLRMRMFEQMGSFQFNPTDWTYNIHHGVWSYSSLLGQYPVFTLSQDCPPVEVARHLELLKPVVISSLASFLPKLAETGINLKDVGVKVVTSNSETSSLSERLRLEKVFGVSVLDEYSSEELGLLATECRYHRYHATEDDSHLEIIDANKDGVGEVVGTDMWNHAMPFIRYRIGDLASWDDSSTPCECGSHFRTLRAVSGRADQAFTSDTMGQIFPGSLMEACDQFIVPSASGIIEFRLLQHDYRSIELIAVPTESGGAIDSFHFERFRKRMEILFGYVPDIKLTYVDAIPPEASYKRRMIINKMKR